MSRKLLALRVDASPQIGLGHVMRCVALAEAWRATDGEVCFLTRQPNQRLAEMLTARGLPLLDVDSLAGSSDVEATRRWCQQHAADWLAVDGYHFDVQYLKAVRSLSTGLLLVDDLAQLAEYPADVVLNPNLFSRPEMYAVSSGTTRLCGTQYALLRPEFNWPDSTVAARPHEPLRLLVLGGGANVGDIGRPIVAALEQIETPLWIRLMVGPVAAVSSAQPSVSRHRVEVIRSPNDIAPYMRWADLAITAAGCTCWELARLGVPMLLVVVADNQQGNAQALAERGAAILLGDAGSLTSERVCPPVRELLNSRDRRRSLARAAQSLVDGRGAARVAEAMHARSLQLRPVRAEDAHLAWQWANEPEVRRVSFQTHFIPWHEHIAWFQRRLTKPASPYYVAIDGWGRPLGQIRFDREATEAIVSLQLAPHARAQGRSAKLIRLGCLRLFQDTDAAGVIALIKPENIRSQKAFERAGFQRADSTTAFGQTALRYVLPRTALLDELSPHDALQGATPAE